MQISARADYAVRACLVLAGPAGSRERALSAEAVAMLADIPVKFFEAILADLRTAGIVRTQRGAAGGCRLAREAATLTVLEVVEAVDGPVGRVRGLAPDELHYPATAGALAEAWSGAREALRRELGTRTLASVLASGPPA